MTAIFPLLLTDLVVFACSKRIVAKEIASCSTADMLLLRNSSALRAPTGNTTKLSIITRPQVSGSTSLPICGG